MKLTFEWRGWRINVQKDESTNNGGKWMFDMSGHSIKFTGAPVHQDDALDLLTSYVPFIGDAADLDEVTMVCWGEDLARVPLVVWTDAEKPTWINDTLTEEHAEALVQAGLAVNAVIREENATASA